MQLDEKTIATLTAIERHACQNSLYQFLLSFWDVIVPEQMRDNWHLKTICDEVQACIMAVAERKQTHDLVINVPPGSTKTTIVMQTAPAWAWTVDPTLRLITSSHGETLSIEAAMKSRDILKSPKYARLFPEIYLRTDKSAKKAYENTHGGTRDVTSTGGSPTGRHAHIKLMDDLQDIAKGDSMADREQAINHMKTLFTREVDKGKSVNILIMQRLHENDCTAYMLGLHRSRGVRHICLPAILDKSVHPAELATKYTDGLLDPLRMSPTVLADKKIELGSYGFSSQFMQTPTPPEGDIIKRKWFKKLPYDLCKYTTDTVVFFVDTAYSEANTKKAKGEPINDPSAILATTYRKGVCYLLGYAETYADIIALPKWIKHWATAQGYTQRSIIYIEPKASGKSAVQMLRKFTDLNIAEIQGGKNDKMTELMNTSPTIESGRFILADGVWNSYFIDRVCGFPHQAHDEAVDLLCYARKHYFTGADLEAREQAIQKARRMLGGY